MISWYTFAEVKVEDFSVSDSHSNNAWKLIWRGKEISTLQSIGPEKPKLLKIDKKSLGASEFVYLFYYDSGIAGTLTQTQVERVLLFTEQNGEIHLSQDHPFKIIRFRGDKTLLEETRKINFHNKEIKLDAFDEEDPVNYKFIGGKLISLSE